MRKLLCLLVVGLVMNPTAASAVTRYWDPNDTRKIIDVHKVATDQGHGETFIQIIGWDRWAGSDIGRRFGSFFRVSLDTLGGARVDRLLDFFFIEHKEQYFCEMLDRSGDRVRERLVANYEELFRARISCTFPSKWLGYDSGKRADFYVDAWSLGRRVDRAPDARRYRGLRDKKH